MTASAAILLAVAVTLIVWWALSSERRTAKYDVRGALSSVELDLGDADLEVVGAEGTEAVRVRRVDRFAFGRPADAAREVRSGVLRLSSRCPEAVLGFCDATYRLQVPDNVSVAVRTSSGDVDLRGFRGSARIDTGDGDISVDEWCGFVMRARADTGDVRAAASCTPERLELRSREGSVLAQVPEGRYRVDAESDEGARRVRGVTVSDDSPFTVQALSSSGDVDVQVAP